MKLLTLLGLFVILSLALGACSSAAQLIAAPESESAAARIEEPAVESVQEAAAVQGATDDKVVLSDSAKLINTGVETSNGISEAAAAESEAQEARSIAEIAEADGRFTTLVYGLEAAGLHEMLAGEGEFTVFAPTDDAFAALPEGALDFWNENPQGALKDVLQFHVVDGVVRAEEILGLIAVRTLLGEDIAVSVEGEGQILLNDSAQVIITDIEASNGVIHVIDAVLVPAAGLG
jgi:uncharacterized surface protein with fasciclin (FAS1) repeats